MNFLCIYVIAKCGSAHSVSPPTTYESQSPSLSTPVHPQQDRRHSLTAKTRQDTTSRHTTHSEGHGRDEVGMRAWEWPVVPIPKFNGSFYLLYYVMVLTILQQTNPHRQ